MTWQALNQMFTSEKQSRGKDNKPFSFTRMVCDWLKMSVAMRLQMT